MVSLDLILNLSLLVSLSIISGFIENRWSHHTRPLSCWGFRCNIADSSFLYLFAGDATCLLGLNSFGMKMEQGT